MRIDEKRLNRLLHDEYLDATRRLERWIGAAEEALREPDVPRHEIYDLLFWTHNEFRRRRVYLEKEMPELERRAQRAMRALEDRGGMRSETTP